MRASIFPFRGADPLRSRGRPRVDSLGRSRSLAPPTVQGLDLGSCWHRTGRQVSKRLALGSGTGISSRWLAGGPHADRRRGCRCALRSWRAALILEGVEPATGQILPTGQWLNARLCSMASGRRYALEVAIATEMTRWPFSVTPKQRQADLVFLAPTFTSLAYADERLPLERFPRLCDMPAIASPRPIN